MGSKVEVLCPNGHRVNIKTNPNSKLIQILEEACSKKGFNDAEYDLYHPQSRKNLDLTLTVRFAGLQNNAKLEMVKAVKPRESGNVTVAIQLETGERLKGNFTPTESLLNILHSLEKEHSATLITRDVDSTLQPVCVYLREEITGEDALKSTTLKDLGLITGSGILRLLHKPVDEATLKQIRDKLNKEKFKHMKIDQQPLTIPMQMQKDNETEQKDNANVELSEHDVMDTMECSESNNMASDSSMAVQDTYALDFSNQLPGENVSNVHTFSSIFPPDPPEPAAEPQWQYQSPSVQPAFTEFKFPEATKGQDLYQNELKSDCEILKHQPCVRDVVCYSLDENIAMDIGGEEPDDEFFDLTVSDVRRMYSDLQKQLSTDDDAPLMTNAMRKLQAEERVAKYDHVFIRFTFPDKLVLQATFRPKEPVYNLYKCLKEHLKDQAVNFHLFTTPPRRVLKDKTETLIDAGLVPMTIVYVAADDSNEKVELSSEITALLSSQMSANAKLIETVHRPIKRPADSDSPRSESTYARARTTGGTTGVDTKVPKWFKVGKK